MRCTGSSDEYEGSITIDEDVLLFLGVRPYQMCQVNNRENGIRITTYVIPGKHAQCEINGAASRHFSEGDRVHINFFGSIASDAEDFKPKIWGGLR